MSQNNLIYAYKARAIIPAPIILFSQMLNSIVRRCPTLIFIKLEQF